MLFFELKQINNDINNKFVHFVKRKKIVHLRTTMPSKLIQNGVRPKNLFL